MSDAVPPKSPANSRAKSPAKSAAKNAPDASAKSSPDAPAKLSPDATTPALAEVLKGERDPGPGQRRIRLAALAALAVLLLAAAVFWTTRGDEEKIGFRTGEAVRGDLTVTVTATGNLAPINQVDVGSELSGIVRTVEADFNDRVQVGQVLARIDTSKLKAQALQARAALAAAEARVLQARATVIEATAERARLEHVRELSGGQVPSQRDLDTAAAVLERARADQASAEAQVAQARATLDVTETDLKKSVIRSPINGIVLKRQVEPGQTVAASLQAPVLFTLAEDLAHMELHVDVDEADVGEVSAGQEAAFTVDAYPDRSFPARVSQVRYGAETVSGVVTYKAVLGVDNADLALRPGMTATADIRVRHVEDALLVPNAALRFAPPPAAAATTQQRSFISRMFPRPPRPARRDREQGGRRSRVWVLKDGAPEAIPVTTGASDGSMTEVLGGEVTPGMALLVATVTPRG